MDKTVIGILVYALRSGASPTRRLERVAMQEEMGRHGAAVRLYHS
jgi:hypothetical protein